MLGITICRSSMNFHSLTLLNETSRYEIFGNSIFSSDSTTDVVEILFRLTSSRRRFGICPRGDSSARWENLFSSAENICRVWGKGIDDVRRSVKLLSATDIDVTDGKCERRNDICEGDQYIKMLTSYPVLPRPMIDFGLLNQALWCWKTLPKGVVGATSC